MQHTMALNSSLCLPTFARKAHAGHCKRCLFGLPSSHTSVDASRLVIAFYCLGSLDVLGVVEEDIPSRDREAWRSWIWAQQARGKDGSGFRPPFMIGRNAALSCASPTAYGDYDTPHIIITYAAMLSLAILRDDFSELDRSGIVEFLRSCQRPDGSFSTVPGSIESDLRTMYCAFALSNMLNDWSGVDINRAVRFLATCRTYEGGYGQSPFCEAHGGTTYTAIAALALASGETKKDYLSPRERQSTVYWLTRNQHHVGGFCGRTGKDADSCYCFWSAASLKILGADELVDRLPLVEFLVACQFKFGGIAKSQGEQPDPYHTYLSLATMSMYPICPTSDESGGELSHSLELPNLDPLLNAKEETVSWIRDHIPAQALPP